MPITMVTVIVVCQKCDIGSTNASRRIPKPKYQHN